LRIDTVEYNHVFGLRLNVWTSIVTFVLATVYFVVVGRRSPGRETEVYTEERLAADRALAGDGPENGSEGDAEADADSEVPATAVASETDPDPTAESRRDASD
jgi:hypothetical protein